MIPRRRPTGSEKTGYQSISVISGLEMLDIPIISAVGPSRRHSGRSTRRRWPTRRAACRDGGPVSYRPVDGDGVPCHSAADAAATGSGGRGASAAAYGGTPRSGRHVVAGAPALARRWRSALGNGPRARGVAWSAAGRAAAAAAGAGGRGGARPAAAAAAATAVRAVGVAAAGAGRGGRRCADHRPPAGGAPAAAARGGPRGEPACGRGGGRRPPSPPDAGLSLA